MTSKTAELTASLLRKGARFAGAIVEDLPITMATEVGPLEQPGLKFDTGKNRLDLIYWPFVEGVGTVLTHGAAKYAPNNWQKVDDGINRYFAAAMRHLIAYRNGERLDPDSGLPHLSHAATNMMFLQYLTFQEASNASL